ncbi:MAG: efflux RND transporter permease subunit [Cytophagales bacterium]
MWNKITNFIIGYRLPLMVATVVLTVFFAWMGSKVEMSYDYANIVPKTDTSMVFYAQFKKNFGEDGNVMVIGVKDQNLFKVTNFAKYQTLVDNITKVPGVNEAISLANFKRLHKNTESRTFDLQAVFQRKIQYQAELDSLLLVAKNVKVYDGLIFNTTTNATLIAIYLNKEFLNSNRRKELIGNILALVKDFSNTTNIETHYAGLPYIRYIMISAFQDEFKLLLVLSALATCIIIFIFFRSFSSVLFTILVVVITVIWTSGFTALFGYKISLLTGMLPALIVVISIPTVVYMFNKYHHEFRKTGDKVKAVTKIIEKIGFVTFMTNANTAVGFFVLVFTDISLIREFGMIAGIMSLATFIITIIVIPGLLMYLPEPSEKQMMHLDKKALQFINSKVAHFVEHYRIAIFITTLVITSVSIYGITQIKAIAFMVDDMPARSTVKPDLAFFEQNFSGVMPLEVLIDLGKKRAAYNLKNLQKIGEFEDYIRTESVVSPPFSILSIIKSATQAYYNDTPENYRIPLNSEKGFILKYFSGSNNDLTIIRSFVDTNAQVVRFSMKVADLGTKNMDDFINGRLKPKINEIFAGTEFKVDVTGTSLLFLKGNQYLLNDLTESMLWAFALISLMMAFMFTDIKMIIISVIPNLIPMLITAGIMGLFDIRMKISTAVIFSISFGITIDSTIHYLSKFSQELPNCDTVLEAVLKSLKEEGISMIYTSIVLILGFSIFICSEFGGTIALGMLTCFTLFFALLTNMILLPALLVTFVRKRSPHQSPSKTKL